MKALVYHKYGSIDNLHFTNQATKPIPKADEILVRVKAASINSWDWDLIRGRPYITRIEGWFSPKYNILGADIAGIVESIGTKVTSLKIGDAIFGDLSTSGWGGFAEYVCVKASVLAKKSPKLSFEETAAVPQAGVLALQGLRDTGNLQAGQNVLINGAGGGVGAFAIQLAKLYGATVTGIDKSEKFDMMQALGADEVIDYQQENFTKNGKQYDLILDNVAWHSIADYKRALAPNGKFVMVGGNMWLLPQVLLNKYFTRTKDKAMKLLTHVPKKEDLETLNTLLEAGKIKSVVDRCFSLEDGVEAFRYYGLGRFKGKVVITI